MEVFKPDLPGEPQLQEFDPLPADKCARKWLENNHSAVNDITHDTGAGSLTELQGDMGVR